MKKIMCVEFGCNFPEGECVGVCRSVRERRMNSGSTPDEIRMDVIGQNGNDGAHYQVTDMINHPPHYTQGSIECIDAMQAGLSPEQFKGYLKGAAFKYIWRLDHKDEAKDNAEKAIWYLQRLLRVL